MILNFNPYYIYILQVESGKTGTNVLNMKISLSAFLL